MLLLSPINAELLTHKHIQKLFDLNEKQKSTVAGGFFPVGKNNYWHGGIHLTPQSSDIITSIADGEIIAYRAQKQFIKGKANGKPIEYSNDFVLMQHIYKTIKGQDIKFYSLYMHLLPWDKYTTQQKKDRTEAYPSLNLFNTQFKVKDNANHGMGFNLRSEEDPGAILGVIANNSRFKILEKEFPNDHWSKQTKYVSKKYTYVESDLTGKKGFLCLRLSSWYKKLDETWYKLTLDSSNATDKHSSEPLGLNVYSATSSDNFVSKILPAKSTLFLSDEKKYKDVSAYIQYKTSAGGLYESGWIKGSSYLAEDKKVTVPKKFNSVVFLDQPFYVSAGTPLGYPGKFIAPSAVHLEIFTPNIDFWNNPKKDEDKVSNYQIQKDASGFKKKKDVLVTSKVISPISFFSLIDQLGDNVRKVRQNKRKLLWVKKSNLNYLGPINDGTKDWNKYSVATEITEVWEDPTGASINIKIPIKEILIKKAGEGEKDVNGISYRQVYVIHGPQDAKEYFIEKSKLNYEWLQGVHKEYVVWDKDNDHPNLLYDSNPENKKYDFSESFSNKANGLHNFFISEAETVEESLQGGIKKKWLGISSIPGFKDNIAWIAEEDLLKHDKIKQYTLYDWSKHYIQLEENGSSTQAIDDGFCDIDAFIEEIESLLTPQEAKLYKDNVLTNKEITEAVKHDILGLKLRGYVAKHPSEWAPLSSNEEKSFKDKLVTLKVPETTIDGEILPMIKSLVWFDKSKLNLNNSTLWHFHPIQFTSHLNKFFKVVSFKQMKEILAYTDKGKKYHASDSSINKYHQHINEGFLRYGLTTRFEQAHFLSQLNTESGRLIYTVESYSKKFGAEGYFNPMDPFPENFFASNTVYNKDNDNKIEYFKSKTALMPNSLRSWFTTDVFEKYKTKTDELKQNAKDIETKDKEIKAATSQDVKEVKTKEKAALEKQGAKLKEDIEKIIEAAESKFNSWAKKRAERGGNDLAGDGMKYKGRGLIQLTWKNNYKAYAEHRVKMQQDSGITSVTDEYFDKLVDRLETDPAVSVDSAFYFWITDRLHGGGVKRKDIMHNGKVKTVTRMVNGGSHGLDKRRESFKYAYEIFHLDKVTGKPVENFM